MISVFKFLLATSLLWPSLVMGMTYVGGSWVDDTAYVYNGTSWVEATKWHHTGSAWQEIEAGAPPEDQTLTINPVPVNGSIVEPGDGTNINCGTGGNDCDHDYAVDTNVTLTAIADSGYQLDSWTGVDVDNGDGTANVTMDSAKTVTASFTSSPGTGALVYWDAGDTTATETQLNVYQEDNGAIYATNVSYTSTGYDGSGHSVSVTTSSNLYFSCTDTVSIDLNKGTIEFWFKRTDVPESYGTLFSAGDDTNLFRLALNPAVTNNMQFRYNTNRVEFATSGQNEFPLGTWTHVKLEWDNDSENELHRLTIDDRVYNGTFVQGSELGPKPILPDNHIYFGSTNNVYHVIGDFDEIKIFDTHN